MIKFAYAISIAAMTVTAVVAGPPARAAGAAPVAVGKMLYAAGGQRLGAVYKIKPDGSPQLILDGKLVTVPADTIASTDGKPTTSLTKSQLKAR